MCQASESQNQKEQHKLAQDYRKAALEKKQRKKNG